MKKKHQETANNNAEVMLDHLYEAYKLAKKMNLQPMTMHCFDFLAKALRDEQLGYRVISSNQP